MAERFPFEEDEPWPSTTWRYDADDQLLEEGDALASCLGRAIWAALIGSGLTIGAVGMTIALRRWERHHGQ